MMRITSICFVLFLALPWQWRIVKTAWWQGRAQMIQRWGTWRKGQGLPDQLKKKKTEIRKTEMLVIFYKRGQHIILGSLHWFSITSLRAQPGSKTKQTTTKKDAYLDINRARARARFVKMRAGLFRQIVGECSASLILFRVSCKLACLWGLSSCPFSKNKGQK